MPVVEKTDDAPFIVACRHGGLAVQVMGDYDPLAPVKVSLNEKSLVGVIGQSQPLFDFSFEGNGELEAAVRGCCMNGSRVRIKPCSYTQLTLPTTYSV